MDLILVLFSKRTHDFFICSEGLSRFLVKRQFAGQNAAISAGDRTRDSCISAQGAIEEALQQPAANTGITSQTMRSACSYAGQIRLNRRIDALSAAGQPSLLPRVRSKGQRLIQIFFHNRNSRIAAY